MHSNFEFRPKKSTTKTIFNHAFDSISIFSQLTSEKRGIDFGLGRGYSGSQVRSKLRKVQK